MMEFPKEEKGKLERLFRIPPLSILNPMTKRWRDRKEFWLSLGIKSELGRENNLLHKSDLLKRMSYKSTSIFDPVLTECIYLWFSKKGDKILDPFAGGSVRGIVASKLKRDYLGIELSSKQVLSNETQAKEICSSNFPRWINDDAKNVDKIDEKFDLIFSCPPYFNLEKYSDDKRDLSNMSLEDFYLSYYEIISKSIEKLKDNSFAVFVVGEVRHKDRYINLIKETIEAFELNGLEYYNEMIFLQYPVSSAMISERIMNASRKIPKCHQQILVFVKGNPYKAANKLGRVKLI